jgi:hypothetical protein
LPRQDGLVGCAQVIITSSFKIDWHGTNLCLPCTAWDLKVVEVVPPQDSPWGCLSEFLHPLSKSAKFQVLSKAAFAKSPLNKSQYAKFQHAMNDLLSRKHSTGGTFATPRRLQKFISFLPDTDSPDGKDLEVIVTAAMENVLTWEKDANEHLKNTSAKGNKTLLLTIQKEDKTIVRRAKIAANVALEKVFRRAKSTVGMFL